MDTGFITQIDRLTPLSEIKMGVNQTATQEKVNMFETIFENAINDVTTTQKEVEYQQYLVATGQSNNAHAVTIATSEAQLAVDMLVQLRNKAIESYNELIRTNL